jgi:uncharacterized membrane protein
MYEEFLHILGFGLCHQLPERSFVFGGLQWPVCARCTGIYLGLIAALAALLLVYRTRQRFGAPPWPFWLFAAAALSAMAYDGFSSYLGWRPTTNFLRLLTGLAVGTTLAVIVYVMLVGSLATQATEKRVVSTPKPIGIVALSVLLLIAVVYGLGPLVGPLLAGVDALAIIITFGLLMLVIVGLFRRFDRSVSRVRDLLLPGAIALVAGGLLIVGAALFKAWIVGVS